MILRAADAPTFRADGTTATGYAAPSRGSRDLSLWRVALAPGAASPAHQLSREEVFLALRGSAVVELDGRAETLTAGDCLLVPAGRPFALVAGDDGFEAVCAMAAGGQATILPDGPTIVPPWAA
ncbi:cupin domain-containing protein [Patulibacter defluvii]|uniref:cupin domain-containing protein n=1 Tax=Patulibacter defluvii TaxID=3095358 RepID=UPI002A75FBCD|nr:cupin domain-containing protein [Patulibacter sp. DM4]